MLNWGLFGVELRGMGGTEGFLVWKWVIMVLKWRVCDVELRNFECWKGVVLVLNRCVKLRGLCGTEGYSFPGEGLRNKETKFSRFHKNVKIHVKCETIVFFSPLDWCQRNFSDSYFLAGKIKIFSTPENDKKNSEYSTCTHIRKFRILYWIFGSNLVKMDLRVKNKFL